ncbi:hypothetical protein E2C01_074955 [Portunus trituberculatus]|uniref:Uncharacterized protein n=1 Tax=Portunus trituberculatus TaxID=210409 RepID=A0A5B7IFM7_PORTR|nr:hypothetical protein [Portunus trituberculatus]
MDIINYVQERNYFVISETRDPSTQKTPVKDLLSSRATALWLKHVKAAHSSQHKKRRKNRRRRRQHHCLYYGPSFPTPPPPPVGQIGINLVMAQKQTK